MTTGRRRAAAIMRTMTDRGAALSDRAPACPFVAFDDDRDERADRPDHRHRCYAEIRPAPRAIAHQESYCLSPRFPSCPTFQDWARREAAQARSAARGGVEARARTPGTGDGSDRGATDEPAEDEVAARPVPDADLDDDEPRADRGRDPEPPPYGADEDDLAPRGRQPRDWAAPPPWAARPADSSDEPAVSAPGAGLATSRWLADIRPGDAGGDDEESLPGGRKEAIPSVVEPTPRPELAGLASRPRRAGREPVDRSRRERPVVGQARPISHYDRGRGDDDATPAWERPRRFEAYPSIRSRVAMPNVPRVALGGLAILVAAVLLLLLPGLFISKGSPAADESPTPSPSASVVASPTSTPAPTPLTYTVKAGDSLTKIATRFKTTIKAIQAANPSLKNANVIAIGQVLVIPTPPPPDVIHSSTAPTPSGSATAAP